MEKLRENARKLQGMKVENYSEPANRDEREDEKQGDYEEGVANIRQKMMEHVKENRNHKKYKSEDFEWLYWPIICESVLG